ncbi:MAG: Clp protease N-terminal domain-containing protein [Hyphomicrobium sp.]|jgi:hypothetical protein
MSTNVVAELGRIPMSPFLTATLTRAADYAAAQAHREVMLEHLLLALAEDPEASIVLKTSNIDLNRLMAEVSDFLGRSDDRVPPGTQNVTISADLRRILEAAAAAAQQGRRREINGAIVLAAIVGDGRSAAAHILRTQGLTFEEAIRALQKASAAAPQARPPAAQAAPQSPSTDDLLASARERVHTRSGNTQPEPRPLPQPPADARPRGYAEAFEAARSTPNETQNGTVPLPSEPPVQPDPAPAPQPVPSPAARPPRYEQRPPAPPQPAAAPRKEPPQWAPPPHPAAQPPRPPMTRTMPPPQPPAAPRYGAPPAPPGSAPMAPQQYPAPPAPHAPRPQSPASPPWQEHAQLPAQSPAGGDRRGPPASGPFVGNWPLIEAGQLVENIPRRMRVAKPVVVEARVARADVKALSDGLQGGGAAYRHEVVVTKAMSVRLRAPEGGFWIEPRSPETQWIENILGMQGDDFASWRWTVTARDAGRRQLQLIVSARTVGADGLTAETALPDQVVDVKVGINYGAAARRMLGWTVAAVAGGVLARFGDGAFDTARTIIAKLTSG